jgi:hypothetical protein
VTSAAGTATLTIDRLGYDYVSIDVAVAVSTTPANTAASILNVLTLTQGDTNTAGASVYTVAAPAASVAVTNQPSVVRLDVDLRGKGRYVKVDATPATSLATTIVARLGKGEVGPETASAKGVLAKYSG